MSGREVLETSLFSGQALRQASVHLLSLVLQSHMAIYLYTSIHASTHTQAHTHLPIVMDIRRTSTVDRTQVVARFSCSDLSKSARQVRSVPALPTHLCFPVKPVHTTGQHLLHTCAEYPWDQPTCPTSFYLSTCLPEWHLMIARIFFLFLSFFIVMSETCAVCVCVLTRKRECVDFSLACTRICVHA